MENGPSMKPEPARGPVTENSATMPPLIDDSPGRQRMTAATFMAKFAEFRAGHVTGTVELRTSNA